MLESRKGGRGRGIGQVGKAKGARGKGPCSPSHFARESRSRFFFPFRRLLRRLANPTESLKIFGISPSQILRKQSQWKKKFDFLSTLVASFVVTTTLLNNAMNGLEQLLSLYHTTSFLSLNTVQFRLYQVFSLNVYSERFLKD